MEKERPATEPSDVVDIEIRCPPETRVLGHLRGLATAIAGERGFSPEEISEIEMAVDEACANVIRHAYKHLGISPDLNTPLPVPPLKPWDEENPTRPVDCIIRMRISIGNGMLRFRIIDNGIGLNNTPCGARDVEEFVERGGSGGLGLFIIKNFMDEVQYDYPPGQGTVVTMTKYLKSARRPTAASG